MDEENLRTIIYTTIKDFFNTEILSALLTLLKASEERIDETNKMIARLSEICNDYATTYHNHLASLEQSRDKALDANNGLTNINTQLVEELSALRQQLDTTQSYNRQLIENYVKLSLAVTRCTGKGTAEVKADINVSK